MSAIEEAVVAYRAALAAAAALDDDELDELAAHLRDAIEDAIAGGRAEVDAIVDAQARLGTAPDIARECARVRGGLAARLAPIRAWAAAGLMVATTSLVCARAGDFGPGGLRGAAMIVGGADDGGTDALGLVPLAVLALGVVLAGSLAAGRAFARVVLLGYLGGTAVWMASFWLHTHPALFHVTGPETARFHATVAIALAGYGGAAALLVPWRTRDLTRRGWALALIAAALAPPLHEPGAHAWMGELAVIYGALAMVGCGARARWGALLALLTGVALALLAVRATTDYLHARQIDSWAGLATSPALAHALAIATIGLFAASAAAALAAGVLAWRRSHRGAATRAA